MAQHVARVYEYYSLRELLSQIRLINSGHIFAVISLVFKGDVSSRMVSYLQQLVEMSQLALSSKASYFVSMLNSDDI